MIVSDMNSGMGGVGTAGGINSYWFARREGHNVRLTSAVRDLETADFRFPTATTPSPSPRCCVRISVTIEIFSKTSVHLLMACDFIAAITQHIPDKSFQLVRYYGWYSNKMRGQREKRAEEEKEAEEVEEGVEIIDERDVIEKMLKCLGLWQQGVRVDHPTPKRRRPTKRAVGL